MSIAWRNWLESANRALNDGSLSVSALQALVADLQAQVAALDAGGVRQGEGIALYGSLQDTLTIALRALDDSGAGALLAVTRDDFGRVSGTKPATITGTAGRVTVADGDAAAGLPTIDLAPVPDAGGGTLLRIVRDDWGRIIGTSTPTTTDLAEGANLYYTDARVRDTVLTGLSTASAVVAAATDTILVGIGKLQAQITANLDTLTGHTGNTSNPHSVTKAQVGLGSVDDTSDAAKPVSTATATALAGKLGVDAKAADSDLLDGIDSTRVVFGTNSAATSNVSDMNTPTKSGFYQRSPGGGVQNSANGADTWNWFIHQEHDGLNGYGFQLSNIIGTNDLYIRGKDAGTWFGWSKFYHTGNFDPATKANLSGAAFSGVVSPSVDNTTTLGTAANRWSVVYAGTGTINTSDAREKTPVAPLTANEIAAAKDLAREVGSYQWLASIAEKGKDARQHIGFTVQRCIEIMEAHKLDAMRYGVVCYDKWDETPEVKDEETGEVTQEYRPAGDRYSFRMDQLCLFMAAGFEARLAALEAKA